MDIEVIGDNRLAVLTPNRVHEVDFEFNELSHYELDHQYRNWMRLVRIDSQLYVLGMIYEDGFWGFKNDLHLIPYGESRPVKVWRCGHCGRPRIINFYDYENQTLVYAAYQRGRQELRIIHLGTLEEQKVSAIGYALDLRVVGIPDEARGLQDLVINAWRDQRFRLEFGKPTTIRLSQIDLSKKRSHILQFESQNRSPDKAHRQEGPVQYTDHVRMDFDSKIASIGIHKASSDQADVYSHYMDSKAFLWWEIESEAESLYLVRAIRPLELKCNSADGTPFESYLVAVSQPFAPEEEFVGTTLYELREGGYWREVYHSHQWITPIRLFRPEVSYLTTSDSVLRLERGTDFCVEDLEEFNHGPSKKTELEVSSVQWTDPGG